ncbi:MAG: hypothetical protein WC700_19215, partial [Gemmatimonadaceae bacterium]
MRASRIAPLVIALAACTPRGGVVTGASGTGSAFDVVIENGRLIDGTGAAWFYGDVAVRGDRIAAIGPRGAFSGASAARRVNAAGHVVSPGFIDIQAQSYGNFMTGDGTAISMVTQGITTAILGEGETPAPVNDKILALETDSASRVQMQRFMGPRGFGNWLDFMVARG